MLSICDVSVCGDPCRGCRERGARQFQFSVPCICKALGRRRATGETEVRPQRNRQTLKLGELHASIAAEVARRPDITPAELRAWLLGTHQSMASVGFMHNTLELLGIDTWKAQ